MEQDAKHKEALRLFQDGEYEQAIEAMAESGTVSDGEYKDFVGQCKMVLTDQYKYLIDEAISEGNSGKAKNLQEEFLRKFGQNDVIESISIPDMVAKKMVECPICCEMIEEGTDECPYCHENIESANKAHSYQQLTKMKDNSEALSTTATKQPPVNVSKPLVYTIMVIVVLVSLTNLLCETDWLSYFYPKSFWVFCSLAIIISALTYTAIDISRNKWPLTSMRLWVAIEIFSLCLPIELHFQINDIGFQLEYLRQTVIIMAILGTLSFFMSKHLNANTFSLLYIFGSIFCVLISVVMLVTYYQ